MTREEAIKVLKELAAGTTFEKIPMELKVSDVSNMCEWVLEALEQEPCEEHKREFIEIVVNYPPADLCTYPEYKGKPYFSIKYRENGKEYVGYGTYKIEMLSQWIKQCFMSDNQPKTRTARCNGCRFYEECKREVGSEG